MSKWFRAYDSALDDPKVQRLPGPLFKAWFNLLCLASRNDGAIPPIEDVAFALRIDEERASEWVYALISAGLIDEFETGMAPHNWDARQFKSDVSTDRVKRFRKQAKTVSETVVETPPEQNRAEADTEAEKKVLSETASPPRTTSKPSDEFLSFWRAYPTTPIMSRKEAWTAWGKISPEDRKAATDAVEPYRAYCRTNPTYSAVHACRFLSQRRFEGFQQQAPALALVTSGHYAKPETPQWEAWAEWWRATKGKSMPRDAVGGWHVPSEWPPNHAGVAA
jgi:hypothetical protein